MANCSQTGVTTQRAVFWDKLLQSPLPPSKPATTNVTSVAIFRAVNQFCSKALRLIPRQLHRDRETTRAQAISCCGPRRNTDESLVSRECQLGKKNAT